MTAVTTEKTKSKTLRFILARLSESSTYRGILLCLTAIGVVLKPEVSDAIVAVGIAAAGLAGVLMPDASE